MQPGSGCTLPGRIYFFAGETTEWDGEWLVLLVSVPEADRGLRRRARTKLAWAGFGSPAPGVWVTPRPGLADQARVVLRDLGLDRSVCSFVGARGGIGHLPELVDRAWDLPQISARYDRFIATFGTAQPADEADAMLAQIQLVHEWRRFPFFDPQLPMAPLPANWSGRPARQLFHDRHEAWREPTLAHWRRLSQVT